MSFQASLRMGFMLSPPRCPDLAAGTCSSYCKCDVLVRSDYLDEGEKDAASFLEMPHF